MQQQGFGLPGRKEGCAPRIGVIGISGYARLLLQSLLATLETEPGVIVAATVINRTEEEEMCGFLEQRGCTIYRDYREMLEAWKGLLDLCIVPVSIHWHAPICVAALHAGANVLVEKPLAGDLADAQTIVEASRFTGKFVAVGFQDIYSPPNQQIKKFLCSRRMGSLREIRVTGSWPRTKAYYSRNGWAGRILCDGRSVYDSPLNNAFAHHLNLGLFFAAPDPDACADLALVEGRLVRHFPIESFDTAVVRLTSREGVLIRCCVTHADCAASEPEILIEMEKGTLRWKHTGQAIAQSWDGLEIHDWSLCNGETNRRHMLRHILASVMKDFTPHCTAEFSLMHVKAIARVHASLKIENCFGGGKLLEPSKPWQHFQDVLGNLEQKQGALKTALPIITAKG